MGTGTHTLMGKGCRVFFKKFQREARAQEQRDGEGGKREKERDLRVASGSRNGVGGFYELCDIDCASCEQKMLFWQSVVVDKSEHSGDRRSAKDVCHEKCNCNVMSVHPSDTSATATTTTTPMKNDNKQHIDDTFVV